MAAGLRGVRGPGTGAGDIHETALRMLARRALSHAEVIERLQRRGHEAVAVGAEVARLERAGLLDEVAVARAVCRAQLRAGRGRRAVVAALRKRKVAREAAAQALGEVMDGDESAAMGEAFARAVAKHRSWRRVPAERRKVVRYLLARGFGLDAVSRALRENGRDERHGDQTDDAGDPPDVP